jgi:hypothetical protein
MPKKIYIRETTQPDSDGEQLVQVEVFLSNPNNDFDYIIFKEK